ncbi:MAG: 2-C-methyl-D-erythritol 4-phosphate cytidylyltransferase [Kiritimatiellae bacterium]|nr:2-C-methyl-D-erythritol 4-phosphate cytidylyltransferase [Kiritimatiellia bacterium]
MVTAVIVAAGKSDRMGAGTDKAFLSLGSRPVIAWSLLAFEHCPDVDQVVLVVRKDQQTAAKALVRMFGVSKIHAIVPGGKERQDSVMAGLKAMDSDTRIVVVHDGARPCVKPETITEVVKLARRTGAAVVGCRIWDTVKYVEKGAQVDHTEDRSKLWAVQTPQAFSAPLLARAYAKVVEEKRTVTDDSAAVELLGEPVKIYESNAVNLKITTVEDLQVAAGVLKIK